MNKPTPEQIQALYDAERPATEKEARETARLVATDPNQARVLLLTCFGLKYGDTHFAHLYRRATDAILEELILERAETDDAFALKAAALVSREMDAMAERAATERAAAQRVARGKPKKARTA